MGRKPATSPVPAEAPSVERWCQELLAGSVAQRRAAAEGLANTRPFPPAAIPLFVRALGDRDPVAAQRVAAVIRELGNRAHQPLLDALRDPQAESGVMKAVARTLASQSPGNEVRRLIEELLCGDLTTQCAAATTLGQQGRKAEPAVCVLLWVLRNAPETKVRDAALQALATLGPLMPDLVPNLLQFIEADPGTDPSPRRAALPATLADLLARIRTPEAIAALLRILRTHPLALVRRAVATCLGSIEPAPAEAIPALVLALADDDATVRDAATQALVAGGESAITGLVAALRHADMEVRLRAAAALGRMAPASWPVVDALAQVMAQARGRVALQAAVAVLKIFAANESVRQERPDQKTRSKRGPADEQALRVVVGVLRDRAGESRYRQEAAEALGRLAAAARPAAPDLAEVMADTSEDRLVRQSAWWAFQQVAPDEAVGLKSPAGERRP